MYLLLRHIVHHSKLIVGQFSFYLPLSHSPSRLAQHTQRTHILEISFRYRQHIFILTTSNLFTFNSLISILMRYTVKYELWISVVILGYTFSFGFSALPAYLQFISFIFISVAIRNGSSGLCNSLQRYQLCASTRIVTKEGRLQFFQYTIFYSIPIENNIFSMSMKMITFGMAIKRGIRTTAIVCNFSFYILSEIDKNYSRLDRIRDEKIERHPLNSDIYYYRYRW